MCLMNFMEVVNIQDAIERRLTVISQCDKMYSTESTPRDSLIQVFTCCWFNEII